jgi:myo-inositol-1(or 4)-monophosphatase
MVRRKPSARQNAACRASGVATPERLKRCLLECVAAGGEVLRRYFGKVIHPRQKDAPSSIVCDADLAAERQILKLIKAQFPRHNIIAEESGRVWQESEYTWVIDPLDGTSNFVSGIPWFGVQVAVLRQAEPILGAMYLPLEDLLYFSARGSGAYRNGKKVRVTNEHCLQRVLCAFGFDPALEKRSRRQVELLFRLSNAVRNTRATNSLVDFCYTIDGRLGGCVNLKTKIWDIAPVALILPEAGGKFTYLGGKPIVLDLGEQATQQNYAILGSSAKLHGKLAALTGGIIH